MRARMNLRSFNPVVLNRGGFCPLEDICLGTSGVVMMGGDSWCPVGRGGDAAKHLTIHRTTPQQRIICSQ